MDLSELDRRNSWAKEYPGFLSAVISICLLLGIFYLDTTNFTYPLSDTWVRRALHKLTIAVTRANRGILIPSFATFLFL